MHPQGIADACSRIRALSNFDCSRPSFPDRSEPCSRRAVAITSMAAASSVPAMMVDADPDPEEEARKKREVENVLKLMCYQDLQVIGQGGFGIACSSVMGLGE